MAKDQEGGYTLLDAKNVRGFVIFKRTLKWSFVVPRGP